MRWDPLAKPVSEADTLFLPDLSSWQAVERQDGFFGGHHNETSEIVKDKYDFGRGKFGPAIRPKAGDDPTFVGYGADGLMPSDEFTIELWARSEAPCVEQHLYCVGATGQAVRSCDTGRLTPFP